MEEIERIKQARDPFKKLRKLFASAVTEHAMIAPNDKILIGLSGGKDSWALLLLLKELQSRAPIPFSLLAVTVDGGLQGFEPKEIEDTCKAWGVPFLCERRNIFEVVSEKKEPGSTFCSMCAKLRRGVLYGIAQREKCTKIALGHHLDDAVETLFLNLFYGGRIAALPPVLISEQGYVPIIRPLLYCEEKELEKYTKAKKVPLVGCACPVCPTHPDYEFSDLKRHEMKRVLRNMATTIPDLAERTRGALRNVEPNRFLDPRYTVGLS